MRSDEARTKTRRPQRRSENHPCRDTGKDGAYQRAGRRRTSDGLKLGIGPLAELVDRSGIRGDGFQEPSFEASDPDLGLARTRPTAIVTDGLPRTLKCHHGGRDNEYRQATCRQPPLPRTHQPRTVLPPSPRAAVELGATESSTGVELTEGVKCNEESGGARFCSRGDPGMDPSP